MKVFERVFVVGPIPPPIHGFSIITERMCQSLSLKADVTIFDRSPPNVDGIRSSIGIIKSVNCLIYFIIKLMVSRPRSLYIGLSGGLGLFFDLIYVVLAKCFFINSVTN